MDYNTEAILRGIINNDNRVLSYCYKKFFHSINTYVSNNSGSEHDAKDIFQEAIIIIYRKLKTNSLNLDCNFKTYLFSVCRFLWLKHLRKEQNGLDIELVDDLSMLEGIPELTEKNFRYRLFQKYFLKLGPECKKLINLIIEGLKPDRIVKILGYTSKDYYKKRRFLCKKALIEGIKSDNEYKDIYDG